MSDVAGLSRIVNIQSLKLTNIKGNDQIAVEGSLSTYRLLEDFEKKKDTKPKQWENIWKIDVLIY